MPTFSFTAVKPKPKSAKKYISKSLDYVEGIVWIDIEGNYYLMCPDGKTYNFTNDSYDTTGYTEVYCKRIEKKNRYILIRTVDNTPKLNPIWYAPFGVGCLVKCTVINNMVKFNKIINKYVEGLSGDAIDYFRKNKKEIYKCLKVKVLK